MSSGVFITLVSGAIMLVLVIRAFFVMRSEKGARRGSLPGTGDHIMECNYSSGVGGGQVTTYRVPKDPQAYAKAFVPRDKIGK